MNKLMIFLYMLFLAYFNKLFGIGYGKTLNVYENNLCNFFLQSYKQLIQNY